MSTPLYDELEAKWSDEYYHRAICDQYWTVTHTATLQTWLEDDEGNEVFPEPQYVEAGLVVPGDRVVPAGTLVFDCAPKRKFKLFGRNQGTNGTL